MFKINQTFSGFSVSDLAKAKEFYAQILRIEVEEDPMGLTLKVNSGQTRIFVYQKDDHVPATFTILNFEVDDIDQAVRDLVGRGIQFERYDDDLPATQDENGILRGKAANQGPDIAWFKDPAGNILSVLQS